MNRHNIEDLNWHFVEDDGLISRRQLDKRVLSLNGSWLTVLFLYQDFNRAKGVFERPQVALVRYRKRKGGYERTNNFNINLDLLQQALPFLARWSMQALAYVEAMDGPQPADPRPAARPSADGPPAAHDASSAAQQAV
jgi:hypothetical protein